MLQDIAAQDRLGAEGLQRGQFGRIENIGLDIDTVAFARIHMDHRNAALAQGRE